MSIEDIKKQIEELQRENVESEKPSKKPRITDGQKAARVELKTARDREKFRKLDTRIKIMIGGFMLSQMSKNEQNELLAQVSTTLDPYNQNAIKKWQRITSEK